MTNHFEVPLTDEQEPEPVKEHTPAPWHSRRDDTDQVTILGEYKGQTIRIAWVFCNTTDEADSRLIEAAPALLDALRTVKTELAHLYHNGQVKANAPERARIQKYILDAEYLIEKIEEG